MKQLHFKLFLTTALLIGVVFAGLAQSYSSTKTLNKSTAVPNDVSINLSNHSGDIKINTTNDNSVSIKTEINVTARSEEDAKKLIKAIENFEFELNGNVMDIDTRFYKSMNSVNGRTTVTLENGDKIKIKEFEIKHEVNIPKSAELNLKNKYSSVILGELETGANLNLYSSKLRAEGFQASLVLETKYSKLQVEKLEDATFRFYDSDIVFKTAGKLDINSKYSKFEGNKTGDLKINSYDDKILINEFGNLKMEAKYSDLVSEAVLDNIDLNLYDCNLKINSAKTATYNGKYSDLKLGNVKNLTIPSSYDNDIYLNKTVNINITESKYSKYIIAANSKLEINSYDDDIIIDELNSDFEGISFDGKYGKLKIDAGSVPYKVDVQMKYGKVNLPESVPITKHIEKSSELEMLGGSNGGTIKIRGYDNTVTVE